MTLYCQIFTTSPLCSFSSNLFPQPLNRRHISIARSTMIQIQVAPAALPATNKLRLATIFLSFPCCFHAHLPVTLLPEELISDLAIYSQVTMCVQQDRPLILSFTTQGYQGLLAFMMASASTPLQIVDFSICHLCLSLDLPVNVFVIRDKLTS